MTLSRELALNILYDIEVNNAYTNITLNKWLNKEEISQQDKHFVTELVYGVVKWKLKIDWIIKQLSNIKYNKISSRIINILRIGIYQIRFLDKIPESAAVDESVKLSKKYGNKGSVGFVNGLLRNYIRNENKIKWPDKKDKIKYLSITYSHPEWMVKRWLRTYGFDFTQNLCEANNETPPMSVRANTLKCNLEQLKQELENEDVDYKQGFYFYDSIIIQSEKGISHLQSFKKGLFQVQDESSMLVGSILNPYSYNTIIDVCAAPGGKSTHIAQLQNNKGKIISRDIYNHKIKLIKENAKRLGINTISTQLLDATKLDNEMLNKADGVVVDAPCSGLGIIRRKPDIKWNKQIQDRKKLIDIQQTILQTSSRYVKKGGSIVYSTCTTEQDENLDVINNFLSENRSFSLVDISEFVPNKLCKETCKEGYIQTYPNTDGIDGFFVAKMIKN